MLQLTDEDKRAIDNLKRMVCRERFPFRDEDWLQMARWLPGASPSFEAQWEPANMRALGGGRPECAQSEFWHATMGGRADVVLSTYRPQFASLRQPNPQRINPEWATYEIHVYRTGHMVSGGFVVELVNDWRGGACPVNYYSWSHCAHEYTHESPGRCLHLYTCSKCGAQYMVDSGD